MKTVFTSELAQDLADDIIKFCKKWGMWKDTAVYTGGKCYTDIDAKESDTFRGNTFVAVSNEPNPERCTSGWVDDGDENVRMSFSNPEHLLDMTFEGPLYGLLVNGEYEVKVCDLSGETKKYIAGVEGGSVADEIEGKVWEKTDAYIDENQGWDPAEFDSYEEYLELNQYCEPYYDAAIFENQPTDFATRDEYLQMLVNALAIKETAVEEYYRDEAWECDKDIWDMSMLYDDGAIAEHIIAEFNQLLEKYGLWYELGFSWCLTAYRD
jgi:hypothetical protein